MQYLNLRWPQQYVKQKRWKVIVYDYVVSTSCSWVVMVVNIIDDLSSPSNSGQGTGQGEEETFQKYKWTKEGDKNRFIKLVFNFFILTIIIIRNINTYWGLARLIITFFFIQKKYKECRKFKSKLIVFLTWDFYLLDKKLFSVFKSYLDCIWMKNNKSHST